MRLKRTRVLLALGAAILSVLTMAAPAPASDVHDVHGEMHRGRIDVDGGAGIINFDTPGSAVGDCEGSTEIRANFDYKTRSVDITGISIKAPFVLPIFGGNYQLEATGVTRSGRATWDHDGNHTWGPIDERLDFVIQDFNEETCEKDVGQVCDGTVEMRFNGEVRNARDAYPDIYVRGETIESVDLREPCSFLWEFILGGATVRLEQVPGSGDPDAWFRRVAA